MDSPNLDRKIGALVGLCRELAQLGVKVGLSDARPALSVRGGLVERKTWIEIDSSGRSFVWRRDEQASHPTDDPAGAARLIADYLKGRDTGPNER
jgi:hypothetical protein